jgi:hypothetical protein
MVCFIILSLASIRNDVLNATVTSFCYVYKYTLHSKIIVYLTFHIAIMLSNSVEGHALKKLRANDPENTALICDYAYKPFFYPSPSLPSTRRKSAATENSSQSSLVSPRGVTCFLFYD